MSAIVLPATMDKGALPELAREMAQLCDKGEAMRIDGSKVSRVGTCGPAVAGQRCACGQ